MKIYKFPNIFRIIAYLEAGLEYILTSDILFHNCSNLFTSFTEKYVLYELSKLMLNF